jgi:hypothetical protein
VVNVGDYGGGNAPLPMLEMHPNLLSLRPLQKQIFQHSTFNGDIEHPTLNIER